MILSEKFKEALSWATELHSKQLRKGTDIPYISHPLAVAGIVMENGGDEEQVIAALLHDAVEDQGGKKTYEEIKSRFGERVANIVAECTDSWEEPKPQWRERKEKYLKHLWNASSSALLVSTADKLHNVRCILYDYRKIGEDIWSRFKASKADIIWYYLSLVDIFEKRRENIFLVYEFKKTVMELVYECY